MNTPAAPSPRPISLACLMTLIVAAAFAILGATRFREANAIDSSSDYEYNSEQQTFDFLRIFFPGLFYFTLGGFVGGIALRGTMTGRSEAMARAILFAVFLPFMAMFAPISTALALAVWGAVAFAIPCLWFAIGPSTPSSSKTSISPQ